MKLVGLLIAISLLAGPQAAAQEAPDKPIAEGRIIDGQRGSGGFGYDPSFVPLGDTRTVAEMPQEEKNRKSHRALALQAFLARFPRSR